MLSSRLFVEDREEVFPVHCSVTVCLVGLEHHLLKFVVTHGLAKFFGYALQVVELYEGLVLTKEDESLLKLIGLVSL